MIVRMPSTAGGGERILSMGTAASAWTTAAQADAQTEPALAEEGSTSSSLRKDSLKEQKAGLAGPVSFSGQPPPMGQLSPTSFRRLRRQSTAYDEAVPVRAGIQRL